MQWKFSQSILRVFLVIKYLVLLRLKVIINHGSGTAKSYPVCSIARERDLTRQSATALHCFGCWGWRCGERAVNKDGFIDYRDLLTETLFLVVVARQPVHPERWRCGIASNRLFIICITYLNLPLHFMCELRIVSDKFYIGRRWYEFKVDARSHTRAHF